MKDYTLKISTPDGDAFSGSALSLSVRGTEGELGILAGHAPFVTAVVPCRSLMVYYKRRRGIKSYTMNRFYTECREKVENSGRPDI